MTRSTKLPGALALLGVTMTAGMIAALLLACAPPPDLRTELRTFLEEADDERLSRITYLFNDWPFLWEGSRTLPPGVEVTSPGPEEIREALLTELDETTDPMDLEAMDFMLRYFEINRDYLACFELDGQERADCVDVVFEEMEVEYRL